jgi:high-affinity Fe2+/Pb2+ permease
MNVPGSKQAFPPESSAEPWMIMMQIFQGANTPNLIRAFAAILFWSLLICAIALWYELWRLGHNWRFGLG